MTQQEDYFVSSSAQATIEEVGIPVRARDRSGKWQTVDVAHLEDESLLRWVLSLEGGKGWDRVIFHLIGRSYPSPVSGPGYAEPEPMLKECWVCEGRGVVPGSTSDPTYNEDTGDSTCYRCQGTGTIERE